MGRPKGYSPGVGKTHTHQVGIWTWNSPVLHSKIQKGTVKECWEWSGSKGPAGNLFGAYKDKKPQMIQPNRLILMEITGEPVDDVSIYMKCHNRWCCNSRHFELQPNRARGYKPSEGS